MISLTGNYLKHCLDKMKQTDEFKFMMQPHETSMKASIEMDNELDLPF
jgi:hypothetical protein